MTKLLILGGAHSPSPFHSKEALRHTAQCVAQPTLASFSPPPADSWVSAGCDRSWAEQIGDQRRWNTHNVAVAGSSSESLTHQCRSIERSVERGMELAEDTWVIIHTGGNDLYYSTSAELGALCAVRHRLTQSACRHYTSLPCTLSQPCTPTQRRAWHISRAVVSALCSLPF